MKRTWTSLFAAALLLVSAGRASAQSVGASAYGAFGSVRFAANDTFEAVTGSTTKAGFGVGGTVTHLWKSAFADVSFWQHRLDGERLFVENGTTYPLGIPLRITYRPFDLVGGWRFDGAPVQTYVGAGVTSISYEETSDLSVASDNVSERKSGLVVLVGVDVPVSRFVRIGGEFRYRSATGVLGQGGVSQAFGEDQLGGAAFAVRGSIGR